MRQQEVILSRGASADISKLATGKGRADVALSALKEEALSPEQIAALVNLSKTYQSSTALISTSNAQVTTPLHPWRFKEVYSTGSCTLGVSPTNLGREVCLKINAGYVIEQGFENINRISQMKYGCTAIYIPSFMQDAGFTDVLSETKVINFIPVLNDSGNRAKYGPNPKISHEALLKNYGLDFVDRHYQALAAGLFRLAHGFPEFGIGQKEDSGDLFEGKRARSGLRGGVIGTHPNYGAFDYECVHDDDDCSDSLVVSGRSPSN